MKWGLFGGTFDPIHAGHLRCAEEIREIFDLHRIIFVPAARPPHKREETITPFHHRERMVRLAIENNPAFSLSAAERERGGTSYSVETVERILGERREDIALYFVLGQDAFRAITTWKEWEKLLLLCHFAVMTRPGYENQGLRGIVPDAFAERFTYEADDEGYRGPTGRVIFFRQVTFLDISSSDIRRRAGEGKSIAYLVPEPVRRYILTNRLYGKTG